MSLLNPFAALTGGLTQGLAQTPFGKLVGLGQTPAPAPAMQPAVQSAQMQPALNAGKMETPDLRTGIQQTALALGIDPLDLATAISYETAGTFDPTKAGPTTQYGRHRGLIQFGEPQAKEYGVDWNNPVGSQLGPDGAIAKYLRKAGVKPGMGLMDIYSAINAGSVGRYGASDAGNGGAPGTVADKVNSMSEHKAKAAAFLGGSYAPGKQTPIDRVFAAATGVSPSGQGQGQAPASQQQQKLTPLQRALAATQGGATSPQAHAGVKLGGGEGQQQDVPASDLGADEIAGLSQTLAQRKMAPDERAAQRKQMIKDRQKPKRKTV